VSISPQAIEILSLSCEVIWLFLKSHVKILSQDDVEELAQDIYNTSISLLNLLYNANYSKIEDKMIEFLRHWSTVKDMLNNLPSPVLVVKTWVKVALINIYFRDFSVLYTFFLLICVTYIMYAVSV
jgi:hypothetical protein